MKKNLQSAMRALLAVAILGIGAMTANAQLPWNPPCRTATVINTTLCTAQFTPWTVPAWGGPAILVPACGRVTVNTPPPGGAPPLTINGIFSQGGVAVPIVVPGPVPPIGTPCPPLAPPPGPPNGWVRGVILGPPPGCCFDVYFYRNSDPNYPCTIILYPGTPPCVP
ncbi:MAG TPA: hypothetical protein VHI13_10460 [Candidatus Kapabacteria bacterium]|nr:hypothetical protein [Candidatus Kapabacteria bacterium]